MPGVPSELAEQRLEVNKTARPIKQKLRRFAKDRKQAIEVEVCKLLAASFIRECQHPVWLANPVLNNVYRLPILTSTTKGSVPSPSHRPGHGLHGRQHPTQLPRLLFKVS
jgi:hypothetical protein